MPAAATDKFKKLSRRWTGQIGAGAVADGTTQTIPLASVTNLPTDTAVVAVIDRVDANGNATPNLEETIIGVVSGSNLTNSVRGAEGTAQGHIAGAVVEILVTAKGYNDIIDGFLVGHNQDGSHVLDTDGTLTANSDTKIASQKAVKTYVDAASAGWIASSNTFVYVSATSFKITGVDKTAIFTKGTRLKFTNNSITVYATVIASAFSTDTTITVATNTDFTINNSAITNPFYSYAANPAGYPTWFNFAPSETWDGTPPSSNQHVVAQFSIIGSTCFYRFYTSYTGAGTANTTLHIVQPVPSIVSASIYHNSGMGFFSSATDASAPTASSNMHLFSNTLIYLLVGSIAAKAAQMNGFYAF